MLSVFSSLLMQINYIYCAFIGLHQGVFQCFLEDLIFFSNFKLGCEIIIGGDFNLNFYGNDSNTAMFKNLLASYDSFVCCSGLLEYTECNVLCSSLSDHQAVLSRLLLITKNTKFAAERTARRYIKSNYERFGALCNRVH